MEHRRALSLDTLWQDSSGFGIQFEVLLDLSYSNHHIREEVIRL